MLNSVLHDSLRKYQIQRLGKNMQYKPSQYRCIPSQHSFVLSLVPTQNVQLLQQVWQQASMNLLVEKQGTEKLDDQHFLVLFTTGGGGIFVMSIG